MNEHGSTKGHDRAAPPTREELRRYYGGRAVLVTGGAGMIGSHLVRRLVALGAHVRIADNLWRGRLENLDDGNGPIIDLARDFFRVDLTDEAAANAAAEGCRTVFHLADIVAGISYVFGNQFQVFTTNIGIDRAVLRAAVRAKVSDYVYVGTACSYPLELQSAIGGPPLREEQAYPANPESGYGWSKLMGEYMAERAAAEGLLRAGVLRLHNVYGPRTELFGDRAQVIPSLVRKALLHPREPFVVWGSGKQRRSFVYADDVADALLAMPLRAMNAGPVQFGDERSISVREIAERIVKLTGRDIPILFDPSRPEGDADRRPDMSRCARVLGVLPRIGLDEGLCRLIEWARVQLSEPAVERRAAS